MFSFLIKKMLKNKWITLSLFMGNILLIGIVSAIPMYSEATMQKLLMKQTEAFIVEQSVYPGLLDISVSQNIPAGRSGLSYLESMRELVFADIPRAFRLPSLVSSEKVSTGITRLAPERPLQDNEESMLYELSSMTGFEDHSKIVLGRRNADTMQDGIIEAVVSRRTYDDMNIILDTVYKTEHYTIKGESIRVRITGVFDSIEENDPYWAPPPSEYTKTLVISPELLYGYIMPGLEQNYMISLNWQQNLDCGALRIRDINTYLSAAARITDPNHMSIIRYKPTEYFSTLLAGYNEEVQKLNITLWVLQVPMFIMLALFIYMVSGQILSIDRSDISVLKSRGASRLRIIGLYFFQGLIISVFSAALGLGLGFLICKVTGASSGFLNLVNRSSLPVSLSPDVFLYVVAASLVSMLTMLIPVIGYSKVTIVDMKREKMTGRKSLWQRFYLDFVALAISLYGLYAFNSQKEAMAMANSSRQSIDPLMFLASSLFVIGLSLLCLRLFPWIVKGIFRMLHGVFSPALYASFIRVIRSVGAEQFIMIFLIFTLATGIFNAKVARTINLNIEDRINHEVGADLRIAEVWGSNGSIDDDGVATETTLYFEPDFGRYTDFAEVESATKVLTGNISVLSASGRIENVQLMGIITDEFGKTAWHREDLLPTHFYNYLNAMSRDPRAVLLSSNLKSQFNIGDLIDCRMGKLYVHGIVYGFVDYWPGFMNFKQARSPDGGTMEQENRLVVANLGYLQSEWGVTPYEIWMRTNAGSGNFLARYANENNIRYRIFQDSKANIITNRNAPVLQGTNGVLTVDFIITLVVCAVGFLIYWILSIKERVLQFGVFRAMGLSIRGILSILINEQILISGFAILLGVMIGEISSELFVPIIQISYSASEQVIPIKIIMEQGDYTKLFAVVGIMILICLTVLGAIVSRIKIAQALKLGED